MGDPVGRIFLSYRREDTRHIAGRLADRLKAQLHAAQVFMDVEAIEPGADFTKVIAAAVGSCDLLIALIGPRWLAVDDRLGHPRLHEDDDFVALEIGAALERGVHVIPVLVDEAKMPGSRDLPDGLRPLATRNAVRLDHETFNSDVGRLLAAVDRILRTVQAEHTARHNRYVPTNDRSERVPSSKGYRPSPSPGEGMPARQSNPAPTWHPPLQEAGGTSLGAGNQPISGVPVVRVAWRIVLWWITYFVSMLAASAVFSVVVTPAQSNVAGGIVASIMLCAIFAGVAFALRHEIAKQRVLVSSSGSEWQVSGNALSSRHVRIVAIICAALSLSIGLAVGVAPPAPQPGGSAPSSLSTSVLPSAPG